MILDVIYRSAFYLKRMMDNVRTSQETHYVSVIAQKTYAIYRFVTMVY
jgi:hypothetical protein